MLPLLPLVIAACSAPTATLRRAPADTDFEPTDTGSAESDWVETDLSDDIDSDTGGPDTDTPVDDLPEWVEYGEGIKGIDVSHWNDTYDWDAIADAGYLFAFVKATESIDYENSTYDEQYYGASEVGMLRGAYHFAIPDDSDGVMQADFFVDHGGAWYDDGQTLPGVLDIEWNPYGPSCYDLSPTEMADWITDFADQYAYRTGRDPIIYTAASWWDSCVGTSDIGEVNPLWVAHWGVDEPNLPNDWADYAFWQHSATGSVPGIDGDVDLNRFNGTGEDLFAIVDGY